MKQTQLLANLMDIVQSHVVFSCIQYFIFFIFCHVAEDKMHIKHMA